MNPSLISALSALAGATIGGFLSILASWLVSRRQVRAQWVSHDRSRREDLYKEFIDDVAKCYVDALLHDKPNVASLVVLYAKLSRIRVLSSRQVIECAEQLIGQINSTYSKPDKTINELQAIEDGSLDIIRDFSQACRAEFDLLRAQSF
jgi:hypothetical protein